MKDLNYILGLDIGVASVGWSVIECEIDQTKGRTSPKRIIDLGVRLWNKVGDPKTGESPAVKRREARSVRRRLRRRRRRLNDVINILIEAEIIPSKEVVLNSIESPWELRVKALDERLSGVQLAKALLHIAKRRGYKSNRRSGKVNEEGKVLEAIRANGDLMQNKGYRTVAEMVYKDDRFKARKRNTTDNYIGVVEREMLEEEIRMILKSQYELGNKHLTENVRNKLQGAISFQLPFANKKQLQQLVGNCEFFTEEPRLAKHTKSAELFVLYSTLNNIRLKKKAKFGDEPLTNEQRELVANLVLRKGEVKYAEIRKLLGLAHEISFSHVLYRKPKNIKEDMSWEEIVDSSESSQWFVRLKGVVALTKALKKVNPELLKQINEKVDFADSIIEALVFNKDEESLSEEIRKIIPNIDESTLNTLLNLTELNGFLHLSKKAVLLMIPELQNGLAYTDAVVKTIPEDVRVKSGRQSKYLPEINTKSITNFNVVRALAQSRVIVNAVIKEYGSPMKVHIELARDISKNDKERREIEKEQADNRAKNEKVIKDLKETFHLSSPRGGDILKYKLWKEQGGKCVYSLKKIPAEKLFADDTYAQIDHILPFSRSLDDSYYNKVLVLSSENQLKRNQTVFEYVGADVERWHKLSQFWVALRLPTYKLDKLTTTEFDERDVKGFLDRDLNDTRYISKYLKNFIEQYLEFKPAPFKQRVFTFKGRFTAMLRRYLGVNHLKNREESNRHHALDAVVVGIADTSMQQKMVEFFKKQEEHTEKAKSYFPEPWAYFSKDLGIRVFSDASIQNDLLSYKELANRYEDIFDTIHPIIVSRKVDRKYTGAAHKETIMSLREQNGSKVMVKRIPLNKLNKDSFDNCLIYGGDNGLVEVLKERLKNHNWDAEKAFIEPIYKPAKQGKKPNQIKHIKIVNGPANSYVNLPNGGIAAQDSMVRIDIFNDKDKYLTVPIYMNDKNASQLPMKAIVAGKDEDQWINISESTFQFSLYPDEYLCVNSRKGVFEGYYVSAHRGTGNLTFRKHDMNGKDAEYVLGIKTATAVKKYYISPLGRKYALSKEKERKVPWRTAPSS